MFCIFSIVNNAAFDAKLQLVIPCQQLVKIKHYTQHYKHYSTTVPIAPQASNCKSAVKVVGWVYLF